MASSKTSTNTDFKPLGDRIAVERIEEKTASGIIIPDTAKEKPVQGVVVAAGEGARDEKGNRIPLEVKVGDVVLFSKWGGTEFKINGQELTIMKESDVLAILNVAKKSTKAA